jgi:hypothetical protein
MPKKVSKSEGIESLIHPISEAADEGTTALIYGKANTGKTAFGSTWPKPLLLLDIQEKGIRTIKDVPGIDRILIDDWKTIEKTFWWLKDKKRKYATIMLDQVTQMQDLGITEARGEYNKDDDELVTKQMWGRISGMMKTIFLNYRNLRDMKYNVLFLAHERYIGGEDEAEDNQIDPSIGARLMPSVTSFADGAVDIIGNTFIRETFEGQNKKHRKVQYCMRIGPHAYYRTKIRLPINAEIAVPNIIVNPTYEKVMRISRGEVSSKPIKKLKR